MIIGICMIGCSRSLYGLWDLEEVMQKRAVLGCRGGDAHAGVELNG